MPPIANPSLEVHVTADDLRAAMERDVHSGLGAEQKWLPPVYFYDDRGSRLFDEITRLPEYYLTRAERRLLEAHAGDIAERTGADTVVELGAGTCEKTRVLLDALTKHGSLRRYVPLDVSDTTLLEAARSLVAEYPDLSVHAVVGDFHAHLDAVPDGERRLFAFLGSTIGNLVPDQRRRFLFDIDCVLTEGDMLLLGTDLVKDSGRLLAAYDDKAGVTAEFNRNVLRVINRELGADFEPERFTHVARWDPDTGHIEMRLRAGSAQTVSIEALDMTVRFDAGEELHTETSAKFTRQQVRDELWESGLVVEAMWEDPEGFLLTLAAPYC